MQPLTNPVENRADTSPMHITALRILAIWLALTGLSWWHNQVLFNDLLENVRLSFLPSTNQGAVIGPILDSLLLLAIAGLFFRKTQRFSGIVLFLLLLVLFFLMAVAGRAIYNAPVALLLILLFIPRSASGFVRSLKIVRVVTSSALVIFAALLLLQRDLMELVYFADFIAPGWIYLLYAATTAVFFTEKWNPGIVVLLASFVLVHSLIYRHPFLPGTLIFAPYLNWTNLHRFRVRSALK